MLQELGAADVEVRPGRAGQFDIEVDGELRYSRAKTRGFPTEAEVAGLVPELGVLDDPGPATAGR